MKKIQLFDQDVTYIVWKSNPTEDLAFERPRGNICRRRSVNKQFSFVSFKDLFSHSKITDHRKFDFVVTIFILSL